MRRSAGIRGRVEQRGVVPLRPAQRFSADDLTDERRTWRRRRQVASGAREIGTERTIVMMRERVRAELDPLGSHRSTRCSRRVQQTHEARGKNEQRREQCDKSHRRDMSHRRDKRKRSGGCAASHRDHPNRAGLPLSSAPLRYRNAWGHHRDCQCNAAAAPVHRGAGPKASLSAGR